MTNIYEEKLENDLKNEQNNLWNSYNNHEQYILTEYNKDNSYYGDRQYHKMIMDYWKKKMAIDKKYIEKRQSDPYLQTSNVFFSR